VPPAKPNPVALLGLAWTWVVLGLWGLVIILKPELEG
jgi:hypothetical protein